MTPQQYIESLEEEVRNATDDEDFMYKTGMLDGAKAVVKIIREKNTKWRHENSEKMRQYYRNYRKKHELVKEDMDKIAEMK